MKEYLNQSVTLKTLTSIDEYGQASYTTKTIKARYEYSRKVVKNRQGEEVISEAECFTLDVVRPGDLITFDNRDWPVISATPQVDINGTIDHYEVRL